MTKFCRGERRGISHGTPEKEGCFVGAKGDVFGDAAWCSIWLIGPVEFVGLRKGIPRPFEVSVRVL